MNTEYLPTDRSDVLLWFNRVLNTVHELGSNAKIILVKEPNDIQDAMQRVLGENKNEKQQE